MKKLLCQFAGVAIFATITVQAQTNEPPTVDNAFTQVFDWVKNLDPSLATCFSDTRGELWNGADFQGGAHNGSQLGLSCKIYKQFAPESITRLADISGIVNSQEAGLGYHIQVQNLELIPHVDAGYNFEESRATCRLGLRVTKAIGSRTFSGLDATAVVARQTKPEFCLFIGLTF